MKRMVLIIIFTLFVSPALAEDYIKLVFDFQHPGGDYIHFQESSARECARKCEKSSRCQAFVFHTSDNVPKSALTPPDALHSISRHRIHSVI